MSTQPKRKSRIPYQLAVSIAGSFCLAFLAMAASSPAAVPDLEQKTLAQLEHIRAMQATTDQKNLQQSTLYLNNAWQFFNDNTKAVLPVLRDQLALELKKEKPNPLILLDIGYFIYQKGTASDKKLAKQALFSLDPSHPMVQQNRDELFHFTHQVAAERDPAALEFIDKTFLLNSMPVAVPYKQLKLDEHEVCAYLYGVYGRDAETHLKNLLAHSKVPLKIIKILLVMGSTDSVEAVKDAMMKHRDFELFTFATTFMMRIGGPKGQEIMLDIKPKDFNTAAEQYYAKIRPSIENTSFIILHRQFGKQESHSLSDKELKKKLAAIYANYGMNPGVNAKDILESRLPKDFLINELMQIRHRMFYKISNPALQEIRTVNSMLNTLHYREK